MEKLLALEVVRITEAAALASARCFMGRGDRRALAITSRWRQCARAFDAIDIRGTIVIGEGERDEAPMLYIGERSAGLGAEGPQDRHRGRPIRGHEPVATGTPTR